MTETITATRSTRRKPKVVEAPVALPAPPEPPAPLSTKIATVITLLQREQGATMTELIGATGWLPHTTRAALSGLRKKGHAIVTSKRDDVTCYGVDA